MKRDLQFVVERIAAMLDDRRVQIVARQHGIKKSQDADSLPKLLTAYIRHADESTLGRLLVETVILHSSRSETNAATVLKDAAQHYGAALQGGHRSRHREGQARVRGQGQGKSRTQAGKQTTGESREEVLRSIAVQLLLAEPFPTGSVSFFSPVDSRPEVCCRSAPGPTRPPDGLESVDKHKPRLTHVLRFKTV